MDLIDRFRYVMKLNNLTASAFADEIGVQRSSVSHVLSGRNKPSLEFIQKVLTSFPKVDASWLINGTTSLTKNVDSSLVNEAENRTLNKDSNPKESQQQLEVKEPTEHKNPNSTEASQGKIKKIIVFYENGSFEEYKS